MGDNNLCMAVGSHYGHIEDGVLLYLVLNFWFLCYFVYIHFSVIRHNQLCAMLYICNSRVHVYISVTCVYFWLIQYAIYGTPALQ